MLTERQREVVNAMYEAIRARRCGYITGRTEIQEGSQKQKDLGNHILYCSFRIDDKLSPKEIEQYFVEPALLALEKSVAEDREARRYYKYYLNTAYLEKYDAYAILLVPAPIVCEAMENGV
jgi:hypothetical protein